MPTVRWKTLIDRIAREGLNWFDIQEELLDVLVELDHL